MAVNTVPFTSTRISYISRIPLIEHEFNNPQKLCGSGRRKAAVWCTMELCASARRMAHRCTTTWARARSRSTQCWTTRASQWSTKRRAVLTTPRSSQCSAAASPPATALPSRPPGYTDSFLSEGVKLICEIRKSCFCIKTNNYLFEVTKNVRILYACTVLINEYEILYFKLAYVYCTELVIQY